MLRKFNYDKELMEKLSPEVLSTIDIIDRLEETALENSGKSPRMKEEWEEAIRRNLSEIQDDSYLKTWEYICRICNSSFSEETILHMYQLLMPENADGEYKKQDNFIVYREEECFKGYAFVPPGAAETPEVMKNLISGYHEWEKSGEVPALVMISCFLMDFVCIHPFLDGNGRMSRLLFVLLLQRHGYNCAKYLMIEDYIQKNRALLIQAERHSQQGWYDGKNTYCHIVEFYLNMLKECYESDLTDKYYQ